MDGEKTHDRKSGKSQLATYQPILRICFFSVKRCLASTLHDQMDDIYKKTSVNSEVLCKGQG